MSKEPLYLAIDQGGHASRAIAFDHQGRAVAEGVQEVGVKLIGDDRVEHDPEQMVASIEQALRQLAQRLGERCTEVVAAGLATQRSSIVCWDRFSGVPLSPIISWQDRRAAQWLEQFDAQRDQIHRKTGLFLTAHYGASKLRWCLDNLPEVRLAYQERRLAFGPMASFLVFRLLEGQPLLADPANASRTLLWNYRSLDWDEELLALFGIPREALPRCVPSRHRFGRFMFGEQSVPLTLVTGDQSAALYAYGLPQSDIAYVNVGTGAFVQRPLGRYPEEAGRLLTSVVLQDGDHVTYVEEGTVNGAGSALDIEEHALQVPVAEAIAHVEQWLAECADPPLFLNGISGLGAPYWVPNFPSLFIGQGEPWEKIVAVVESIVFLIMENVREMNGRGGRFRRIIISGGLTAIVGLCQRLADLAGVPVYRPIECEATARGTAFLLVGKPLAWSEERPGTWFYPQNNPSLAARYECWRRALQAALSEL